MLEKHKIKTLILSGGGVKGFAYIGAFKKLNELDIFKNLNHMITVSIGSVFGLLYLIGYSYEELYEEFLNKNLNELVDYKISNFVKQYGFESGKKFMAWFETLLLKKGISNKLTFNDLYKINPIKYSIVATNLNAYKSEIFSYENTPKMKVLKAIRMSISLPLILTKQNYKNKIYVDGGVINNLPMYLGDDDFPDILGINLQSINNMVMENEFIIDSIDKYMYHVCNCFFRFKTTIDKKYEDNIINIDICNIESFNWNINDEKKIDLIECGYKSAEKYFKEK